MPTLTTLPFLIWTYVIWRKTRGNLLAVIAFNSIFHAASVLNLGHFGVAPWLMTIALFLPLYLYERGMSLRPRGRLNMPAVWLVGGFFLCASISGLVYPFIFAGTPVVVATERVPLHWGLPNIAQLGYLAAAAIVFWLAVTSSVEELIAALNWLVKGCVTAAIIALYQLANAVTHIPYPSALLYSNTSHVIYHAYKIGAIWRLNGPFTEASDMAGALVAGLAILSWELVSYRLSVKSIALFLLLGVVMVMTLSTTGYVCLVILAGTCFAIFFVQSVASSTIHLGKMVALLVFVGTLFTAFVGSSAARSFASDVAASVIFDKPQSVSYKARSASHQDAIQILEDTAYLGAGFGSTRASGLAYTLLAGTGVPGLCLFTAFVCALFLPLLGPSGLEYGGALCGVLLTLLMLTSSMLIAGTEPDEPVFWLLAGTAVVLGIRKPTYSNFSPPRSWKLWTHSMSHTDAKLSVIPMSLKGSARIE